MCKVIDYQIGDRTVRVADIKTKYLDTIVNAAGECKYIDRIVLFGSATQDCCEVSSDIDLAIFGNQSKTRALTSKSYRDFSRRLYEFDDHNQAYDLLYFRTGADEGDDSNLMRDIRAGEILYERNDPN